MFRCLSKIMPLISPSVSVVLILCTVPRITDWLLTITRVKKGNTPAFLPHYLIIAGLDWMCFFYIESRKRATYKKALSTKKWWYMVTMIHCDELLVQGRTARHNEHYLLSLGTWYLQTICRLFWISSHIQIIASHNAADWFS